MHDGTISRHLSDTTGLTIFSPSSSADQSTSISTKALTQLTHAYLSAYEISSRFNLGALKRVSVQTERGIGVRQRVIESSSSSSSSLSSSSSSSLGGGSTSKKKKKRDGDGGGDGNAAQAGGRMMMMGGVTGNSSSSSRRRRRRLLGQPVVGGDTATTTTIPTRGREVEESRLPAATADEDDEDEDGHSPPELIATVVGPSTDARGLRLAERELEAIGVAFQTAWIAESVGEADGESRSSGYEHDRDR